MRRRVGLPYLSLFEEVQGNLHVLQPVESHAALLSRLEKSEMERNSERALYSSQFAGNGRKGE